MSDDELADLLARAYAAYQRREFIALDGSQRELIQEIGSRRVLSNKALAAIFGCTEYRVEQAIGTDASRPRGKLNPSHIPTIAYMLSMKREVGQAVSYMVEHGTSLSTIADLTNISRITLNRWRKE